MMYKNIEDRRRCDAINRQKRVAKQRKEIIEFLGGKCVECGFSDERALAIDHKFGGGTKERKEIGGAYYSHIIKKLKSGTDEYQILCFNCNQIKKIVNNEERKKIHCVMV
jgi:hypothetical protein